LSSLLAQVSTAPMLSKS